MEHEIKAKNSSVINAGITDDYKQAIAEFIWNGFDAGASNVCVNYNVIDTLGNINEFTISDNGKGINHETIEYTFGSFLDSQKKRTYQRTSDVKGKKGKGRFSFRTIAEQATWSSIYRDQANNLYKYSIKIEQSDLSKYNDTDNELIKDPIASTGTIVEFTNVNIFESYLVDRTFEDFLASQFAWFLCLNKAKGYSIKINGEALKYEFLFADKDEKELKIADSKFQLTFIRWKRPIGDKDYYYMMNSNLNENHKQLTSFNNNDMNFYHSVYVVSSYFDRFKLEEDASTSFDEIKNQSDHTYKTLIKDLKNYVQQKQKEFADGEAGNLLIDKLQKNGSFPNFKDNDYERLRKKNLTDTIKKMYAIQPKIFNGLRKEQEKTLIGFINLMLDSEEREKILSILEGVVSLSDEERSQFAELLKSTSIRNISRMVNMLHNRLKVIEFLKILVYDLTIFTTERDHIQKLVEENYWMFGEQYNLVTADKTFDEALSKYLYILDGKKISQKIESVEHNRRPDIFMCRNRSVEDMKNSSISEENIIVELKRPSVHIGNDQYRQIEDYMNFVMKEPNFNSSKRLWKFFIVSNVIEDVVKAKYKSFETFNKQFLVNKVDNYEIYALTWDDVFKSFELNYNYILKKLNFSTDEINREIKSIRCEMAKVNPMMKDVIQLETK